MERTSKVVLFQGRYLGIAVLSVIQLINGLIHTFSGLALLFGNYLPIASPSNVPSIFSFYTLIYGILTTFFAYFLWKEKRLGWIGTLTVSLFVIVADVLTILDAVSVLGIVKTAGIGEIPYCIVIISYLIQKYIRSKFKICAVWVRGSKFCPKK